MDSEKGGHIKHVRTVYENEDRHWKHIFSAALTRPFRLFATEPIVQLLGAYMAFVYGLLYRQFFFTFPSSSHLIPNSTKSS